MLSCLTLAAACGSGVSAGTTAAGPVLVKPPDLTLQGCTYVIDGKVPPGEPTGLQPHFASFSPDQAATDALQKIKAKGGTGLVYGFTLPSATSLYAGPDTTGGVVGTVPASNALLASDPVLWTSSTGQAWLAFFVACGGNNLYWVSVEALTRRDPQAGVAQTIAQLKAAPPYDRSGKASSLPIRIDDRAHLVWKNALIPFAVGRGQLVVA